MTVSSLITAVAIGAGLGLCGRWIVPAGRDVPFWVPMSLAVCAAMLATVIARLSGVDTSGVTTVEVALQVLFAAAGVGLVVATSSRSGGGVRRSR